MEEFKTGVSCSCGSFDLITLCPALSVTARSCYKQGCRDEELVLRERFNEFRFLFPDMKIATTVIDDWCGKSVNYREVRNVLQDSI
ncbi:MAG: hypothetical protein U5K84_12105 [Alkalibacterium sp.]|nr:hypothetical protein [Alkalibacterium sp.]